MPHSWVPARLLRAQATAQGGACARIGAARRTTGRLLQSVVRHEDLATCVAVSSDATAAVSGALRALSPRMQRKCTGALYT